MGHLYGFAEVFDEDAPKLTVPSAIKGQPVWAPGDAMLCGTPALAWAGGSFFHFGPLVADVRLLAPGRDADFSVYGVHGEVPCEMIAAARAALDDEDRDLVDDDFLVPSKCWLVGCRSDRRVGWNFGQVEFGLAPGDAVVVRAYGLNRFGIVFAVGFAGVTILFGTRPDVAEVAAKAVPLFAEAVDAIEDAAARDDDPVTRARVEAAVGALRR